MRIKNVFINKLIKNITNIDIDITLMVISINKIAKMPFINDFTFFFVLFHLNFINLIFIIRMFLQC